MKYKKITIDHAICIKGFYGGNVSYITVSTDGFPNTTNNEISFTELRRDSEEAFGTKEQERYILK